MAVQGCYLCALCAGYTSMSVFLLGYLLDLLAGAVGLSEWLDLKKNVLTWTTLI